MVGFNAVIYNEPRVEGRVLYGKPKTFSPIEQQTENKIPAPTNSAIVLPMPNASYHSPEVQFDVSEGIKVLNKSDLGDLGRKVTHS